MSLINWYKKNKLVAHTALISAGAIGLTASLLCLAFPVSLSMFASLSIWGWAPLVFLPKLPLVVASSCVGLLSGAFSLIGLALAAVVHKKARHFAQHSPTLFADNERSVPNASTDESYKKLLQSSLRPCNSRYHKAYRAADEFVLARCPHEAKRVDESAVHLDTSLSSSMPALSLSL